MWGESWNELVWGGALTVPVLGPAGLLALGVAVGACAMLAARHRGARVFFLGMMATVPVVGVVALGVPHTFVPNTVADAHQVNENFATLAGHLDELAAAVEAVPGGAPEITSVQLSPGPGDSVVCSAEATDPEGDLLHIRFDNEVNGTPVGRIDLLYTRFEAVTVFIQGSSGGSVSCVARAWDGRQFGPPAVASTSL